MTTCNWNTKTVLPIFKTYVGEGNDQKVLFVINYFTNEAP